MVYLVKRENKVHCSKMGAVPNRTGQKWPELLQTNQTSLLISLIFSSMRKHTECSSITPSTKLKGIFLPVNVDRPVSDDYYVCMNYWNY